MIDSPKEAQRDLLRPSSFPYSRRPQDRFCTCQRHLLPRNETSLSFTLLRTGSTRCPRERHGSGAQPSPGWVPGVGMRRGAPAALLRGAARLWARFCPGCAGVQHPACDPAPWSGCGCCSGARSTASGAGAEPVGAAARARTGPICIRTAGEHRAQRLLKGLHAWGAASSKPSAPCWCRQLAGCWAGGKAAASARHSGFSPWVPSRCCSRINGVMTAFDEMPMHHTCSYFGNALALLILPAVTGCLIRFLQLCFF